jgi:hypothetical protein
VRCQCPTHTMEWSGDTCTDSWETWNCSPVTATRPEATFNFGTLNFEVRLASHCKTTGCYPITKLPDNSKQKAQHVKTVKNGMLTKVDDDRSRQRCLKNRPELGPASRIEFPSYVFSGRSIPAPTRARSALDFPKKCEKISIHSLAIRYSDSVPAPFVLNVARARNHVAC